MDNLLPQQPWELDILEMSTSDLAKYEIVDLRDDGEQLNILRSLLRLDIHKMPLATFDEENPPLDKQKRYLFVSQEGAHSARLVSSLRHKGYDNVYSLVGGVEAVRRKFIA
ncbi:MAG TPA: rhodanese-like domain-containing protein [Candidatus Obscuribacterales bacterium]